jgi:hypothetical protein
MNNSFPYRILNHKKWSPDNDVTNVEEFKQIIISKIHKKLSLNFRTMRNNQL